MQYIAVSSSSPPPKKKIKLKNTMTYVIDKLGEQRY